MPKLFFRTFALFLGCRFVSVALRDPREYSGPENRLLARNSTAFAVLWASDRLTTARDWLEPTTDFMLRSHLTRCAARLHLNGGRIPRERLPSARPLPCIRQFTVLALESSADDTCAAVVTSEREILSNVVISQHGQCVYFQYQCLLAYEYFNRHADFGGIHPFYAMQSHQRFMVSIPLFTT